MTVRRQRQNPRILASALAVFLAPQLSAQAPPVAVKAGLIYFAEGEVLLDNGPLTAPSSSEFIVVEEGHELGTRVGRAEVFLQESNYLRLAENTKIRMDSSDLSDVRLEVAQGAAVFEIGKLSRRQTVTFNCGGSAVRVIRAGVYRADCGKDSGSVRVFRGRVMVNGPTSSVLVKGGRMILLDRREPAVNPQKFDRKHKDAFHLWNEDRTAFLSAFKAARQPHATTLGGDLDPIYGRTGRPKDRSPDGRIVNKHPRTADQP